MSFPVSVWRMSLLSLLGAAMTFSTAALAGEVRFNPATGHAETPVWSADGKYIAFEVNRYGEGNVDLFVSSVAGEIAKDGVQVRLPGGASGFNAGGNQVVMNPQWLPNPQLVLFEGSNEGGIFRIYFYAPGGASASEMINKTIDPGNLTFPIPSKDGARLLYITSSTGNGDVKVWERSSGKVDHLTKADTTESFPSFSPDGKRVLFTRKANNTEDVFELDLATKVEKDIAGGNGDQSRPAYAGPTRIVYYTSERGEKMWDLATTDIATGTKTILAKDVRLPTRARPGVSPDGKWVAWTSNDPTKNTVVNIAATDGSKTVTITTPYTACGEPAIGYQTNAQGQVRVLLAYTYLPQAGADWRSLMITDVTDKL